MTPPLEFLRTQKVVQRLEDDVLSKYPIVDSLGRTQQATFVNEDGLYDTILESRKPGAKVFRKWVTSEVLPSIRKQGGYMVLGADEPDEVILARALQIMHTALEAERTNKEPRAKALSSCFLPLWGTKLTDLG